MFTGRLKIQIRAFLDAHFIADDLEIVRAALDLIAKLLPGIFIRRTQSADNRARGRIFRNTGASQVHIRSRGASLRRARPYKGEALPPLGEIDGIILPGGLAQLGYDETGE